MQRMKNWILFIILAFICLNLAFCTKNMSSEKPGGRIDELIKAIQNKDFKKAFELSPFYMLQIANIKASNPKVLWEKKIAEFFGAAISELNDNRKIETVLSFIQYDMTPISSYKLISYFFPPNAIWRVIETRGTTNYITVEYPEISTSPILKSMPLKKTMFQFEMSEDGLFNGCSYMEDGEERWESSVVLKIMETEKNKQRSTMKNMYILSGFISNYIKNQGAIPKYEGILNETSDIFVKLSMAGRNLPLKDGWGKSFYIVARMMAVGAVGYQEGNSPDFVIISYGKDGLSDDESGSPYSLDTDYNCGNFADFNKDIKWRNKGFIKMPKLTEEENLILNLNDVPPPVSEANRIEVDNKYGAIINVNDYGNIYLNGTEISIESLLSRLRELISKPAIKKVYLKAVPGLNCKDFIDIFDLIRLAGINDLSIIVSEKPEKYLNVKLPTISDDINETLSAPPGTYAPIVIPDNFKGYIVITIYNSGIYINLDAMKYESSRHVFKTIYDLYPATVIFVRSEARVPFNLITEMIEEVNNVGFKTIGIIPEGIIAEEEPKIPEVSKESVADKYKNEINNFLLATKNASKESSALEPVRTFGGIKPPKVIKVVEPITPKIAAEARVAGVVILEVTSDINGKVKNWKVLRSIPLLDQAAIEAVRQWVFEPLVIDGQKREAIFTVTVRFK